MDNELEEKWRQTAKIYMDVPWHVFLEPELVSISKSVGKIAFTTTAKHLTPAGTLHGGGMYIGLELANAIALIPHVYGRGVTMVTVDTSFSLIGTVAGEGQRIVLEAKMLKRSKRIAFFEASAYDEQGNLLAKSKTTKAIVELRATSKL